MIHHFYAFTSGLLASLILTGTAAAQTSDDAVAEAMRAPGAKITLPVSVLREGFDKEFVDSAREQFSNFHMQFGGDHAFYYTTHFTEFVPAAMAFSRPMWFPATCAKLPRNWQLASHGKRC